MSNPCANKLRKSNRRPRGEPGSQHSSIKMVILYFSPRHLSPLALVHSLELWPLNYSDFFKKKKKTQQLNHKTSSLQPSSLPHPRNAELRAGECVSRWAIILASAMATKCLLLPKQLLFSHEFKKLIPTSSEKSALWVFCLNPSRNFRSSHCSGPCSSFLLVRFLGNRGDICISQGVCGCLNSGGGDWQLFAAPMF